VDIEAAKWKALKLFTLVLHLITFQMHNQVTKLCNLIWYIESLRIMGWQPIRLLSFIHRNKQHDFLPKQTREFYSAQCRAVTVTPAVVFCSQTEQKVWHCFSLLCTSSKYLVYSVYSATNTDILKVTKLMFRRVKCKNYYTVVRRAVIAAIRHRITSKTSVC